MGLFTDTQVITADAIDHTFSKRGQIPNPKALVSEYFEPADIANDSKITAKYENSNSPAQRSVLSSSKLILNSKSEKKKVTINTSVAYDKDCSIADVENFLDVHCAALGIAGVRTRFLQRMP